MKKLNIYIFILLLTIVAILSTTCSYDIHHSEGVAENVLFGFPLAWFKKGSNSMEYYVDIIYFLIDFIIYYLFIGFCFKLTSVKSTDIKLWIKYTVLIIAILYLLLYWILFQGFSSIAELPTLLSGKFRVFPFLI